MLRRIRFAFALLAVVTLLAACTSPANSSNPGTRGGGGCG